MSRDVESFNRATLSIVGRLSLSICSFIIPTAAAVSTTVCRLKPGFWADVDNDAKNKNGAIRNVMQLCV
ncbi:MAG: hypothetical protein K2I26_09870 [Paramuribaculum sp.]|nr:hypothetical protein [Paramuribaculum sp.]